MTASVTSGSLFHRPWMHGKSSLTSRTTSNKPRQCAGEGSPCPSMLVPSKVSSLLLGPWFPSHPLSQISTWSEPFVCKTPNGEMPGSLSTLVPSESRGNLRSSSLPLARERVPQSLRLPWFRSPCDYPVSLCLVNLVCSALQMARWTNYGFAIPKE